MIIQHNLEAQANARYLNINSRNKAKTSERLGSGYKLNRAADDAAGLAISEKMRWQIRGLNKASLNSQDGISMIQTADGALNEVHDLLHRMNELAVQAANDTNTQEDRQAIQQEINQLTMEINRISDSTEFNTIPVLKIDSLVSVGNGQSGDVPMNTSLSVTTATGLNRSVYGTEIDFSKITEKNIDELIGKTFSATCTENCSQVFAFSFNDGTGSSFTLSDPTSDRASLSIEIGVKNPAITTGEDIVNEIMQIVKDQQTVPPFDGYQSARGDIHIGHANGISSNGATLQLYAISGGPPYQDGMGLVKTGNLVDTENTIKLQVGAEEGNTMNYIIRTINASTIGVNNLNVMSHEKAGKALTSIKNALTEVSDYRSYLGAMQNRLEFTIKNLDNTSENVQASESLIRDANMADEMVSFSKSSILEQAGQAMLSQANSSKQGILTLIQ
ncbi:MAG: flagellin [Lachnospiraceae bacterium]|nr:flagellin [Lachnospiraceae bacterium]